MNEKRNFRHNSLYTAIDVREEMRFIERNFKKSFIRLKGINNLASRKGPKIRSLEGEIR